MRLLERNKREFFYAELLENKAVVDEYGRRTGDHVAVFSEVKRAKQHIGVPSGDAKESPFGTDVSYDRVILMEKPLFDENAALWIDRDPKCDGDGKATAKSDYKVKKIAPSINCVAVAVEKVV